MRSLAAPLADFLIAALTYRQRELLSATGAMLGLLTFFVAMIYGLVLLQRHLRRKAQERTREIQAALGPAFASTEATAGLFLALLSHTSPTLRGQNIRHLKNRFEGAFVEGQRMQLVEAGYDVSTGKGGRATVWQTIAYIGQREWHFPPFSIRPRGFWSRLGLGRRGVVFEARPKFTALYRVQCEDEAAARTFLTGGFLDALERLPGLTIEGRGNNVVFFRRRKMLPAAQFPQFQLDARQLAALLPAAFGKATPPPMA